MGYNNYGAKSRGIKWLAILGVFLFVFFIAAGGLLASNYKHFGNLLKVISLIRTQYLHPVDSTTLVDGAVKGLVESLNDPYSVYLEPRTFAQLQQQIKGSFGGLGILVGIKQQYITVVRVYQGTPAAREGVAAGDIITRIDERDARGLELETAISLMRGPVGSKVTLTVNRPSAAKPIQISLVREEISVPTVEGRVIPDTKIGYLVISQFTERTAEEMREALTKLQNEHIKGILLDLRDNPGGELLSAVKVAERFVPKGPVVHVDYRIGRDNTLYSEGKTLQLPLVVLINGGSASASEILAGAVKDTGAGTLVGSRTFGKGIVQTVFPLEHGAGLKLTTARYLTPNGNYIHEKGVEPDMLVEAGEDRRRDVQFERGLEILKTKVAG